MDTDNDNTFTSLLVSVGFYEVMTASSITSVVSYFEVDDDEGCEACDMGWCECNWDGTLGSERVEDAIYSVEALRFENAMEGKLTSARYALEAGANAVSDLVEYMAVDMAGELDFYLDYLPTESAQNPSFDSTDFAPYFPKSETS